MSKLFTKTFLSILFFLSLIIPAVGSFAQTPGGALNFNGNNSVSINSTLGNFGTGDFTIEMKINTTETNGEYILSKRSFCGNDNFLSINIAPNGKIGAELDDMVNGGGFSGNTSINNGNWHQIALTRKGANVILYIDGIVDGKMTNISNLNNIYTLTLGTSVCVGQNGNGNFNGSMDELRFWGRALCQSEIQNNANCELPNVNTQNSLLAYYHFNQGFVNQTNTGNTLTDATAHANTGTLNNFTLTGTTSNWVAGAVTGTCSVYTTPVLSISASGPTSFCSGGQVVLAASGGNSYIWSTGETTRSITVTSSGNYSVSDPSGCSNPSATTAVVVNTPPSISVLPATGSICAGQSIKLTANSANSAGTALQFGPNNYTVINNNIGDDFTIEAWIKTTDNTHSGTQFYQGSGLMYADVGGVNNDFGTAILNGKFAFGTGNPDITIQSTTTVTDGKWHHVAAVRHKSSSLIEVYVDGKLENSTTTGNTGSLYAPAKITMGGNTVDGRYFLGTLDEMRIWNVPRSAAEIASTLNTTIPVNTTGLVGYWRFNEGSGSTAVDISSAGNSGTLINNPAWVVSDAPIQSSYSWSPATGLDITNGAVVTANPTVSTTYTITAVNASGCNSTLNYTVTVNPLGTATISQDGPLNFCQGGSVNLTASPASSYLWSNGATTRTISANTTGSYSVNLTTASGCKSVSAAVNVGVSSIPTVTVNPATAAICAGTSIQLSASGPTNNGVNDFKFTGNNSISIPSQPQLVTTNVTLQAWVKPSISGDYRTILTKETSGGPFGYGFRQRPDNSFWFIVGGEGYGLPAISTTRLTTDTWYHLTGTFDGTTVKIYVNGKLENTVSETATINSTAPLKIGGLNSGGEPFVGSIDEVTVWNITKTANEIQCDYANSTDVNRPGLVGYWKLDEGAGSIANDASSYHNNAPVSGTPNWEVSTAPVGLSYNWTAPAMATAYGSCITVTPSATTTYTATGTNSNGCKASATSAVTVNPIPTFTFTQSDVSCPSANDGKITVTGSGENISYQYSKDGGTTYQTSNIFNSLSPGNYNIIIQAPTQCVSLPKQVTIGTVPDVTPPVPDNAVLPVITAECSATVTTKPTATDACSGSIVGTTTNALNYNVQGNYTINWKFTDKSGNSSTQTQQVIIKDVTKPVPTVLNLPDITSECNVIIPNSSYPTANDNCSGLLTATADQPTTFVTQGTYFITWTYHDGNGNDLSQTQKVIVKDVTPPQIINCVSDKIINLNPDCGVVMPDYTNQIAAVDNCTNSSQLKITQSPAAGTILTGAGSVPVIFTVTDAVGLYSTCSMTLTKNDVTAPLLAGVPANATVECDNVPAQQNVSASDACGINGSVNAYQFPSSAIKAELLHSFAFENTAADNKGNATATNVGGVTYVNGIIGQAASFNGSGQYLNYGTSASISGVGNFAISVWVKTSSPAGQTIVQQRDGGFNGEYMLNIGTNHNGAISNPGKVYVILYNSGFQFDFFGNKRVDDGTWHHIVFEREGTNGRIFIDGTLDASASGPIAALDPSIGTYVGRDVRDNTKSFTGLIDELHIISGTTCSSNYDLERTWSVKDNSANETAAQQIISVRDRTAPVLTVPADITVSNDLNTCGAKVNFVATATDNCSTATVSYSIAPNSIFNVGTTTVTVTAKDACGNQSQSSFNVTVQDLQAPVITTNGDKNVNNDATLCGAVVNVSASATDNCGVGNPTGVRSDGLALTQIYPVGTTTITWNVTDIHSNAAKPVTQVVTVTDKENPTITAPAAIVVNNDATVCGAKVSLGVPVTADNCGVGSVSNDAPALFPVGTTTVTWTVKDIHGNTNTATQTVTVNDNEAPVVSGMPGDMTVTTDAGRSTCDQVATWIAPTATDNCGTVTITSDHNSGDVFPVGSTAVTYTFTDIHNNVTTKTFNVTVVDNTPPVISGLLGDQNFTTGYGSTTCSAVGSWTPPTATDNCGTVTVTSNHNPGDVFPVGSTPVTYTFTDIHNNSISTTFNVNVVDNTVPTITTTDVAVNNDKGKCGAIVPIAAPVVSDNCGTTPAVGLRSDNLALTDSYPVGTTTITWTETDIHGNSSSTVQSIVVTDNENPTIVSAGDQTQTADAGVCKAAVKVLPPTTGDNCGVQTLTNSFNGTADGSGTYPVGTTVVTWTVTDIHGNTNTTTQSITVTDNEKPTITSAGDQTQTADAGVCKAAVKVVPPTTGDNCGVQSVTNSYNGTADASGIYPVGTTVVTWTVTDIHGNTNTTTQSITVTDNEKPTISAPASIAVNNDKGQCSAVVALGTPATADNCGVATVTNNALASYPVGTTTVTWTVTDIHGNSSTATQTVTVTDNDKPTITAPANIAVNNDKGACSAVVALGTPVTADNCGVATVTNNALASYPVGTTTVTWTVTDIHGNSSTATQTVTVTDNENPTITAPANIAVNNDKGQCSAVVALGTPTTADNCGVATVTNNALASYPVGTTTVTWTVTDIHGNSSTATQTVTVTDNEKPTISTTNVAVNNDKGACAATVILATPVTHDNCGVASVTNDHAATSFPVGTTVVNWTVTDIHGNSQSTTQTVVVTDNERPIITTPAAQIFCANYGGVTKYTIPVESATDNCGVATTTYAITGATTRSGNGSDASGDFAVGTSTITWTVTDIHGNVSTASSTVTIKPLPVASYTTTTVDNFCSNLFVTASSSLKGSTYNWLTPTGTTATTSPVLQLNSANADGTYTVYVTANGCRSEFPVTYTYAKQNQINNYTILGFKEVDLGLNNTVQSGSVGVTAVRGQAEMRSGVSIASPGAFLKAARIDIDGTVNIPTRITSPASPLLPTMIYNTTNTRGLPYYQTRTATNATIAGNYSVVYITAGSNITLTGNTFGVIQVEKGANVTFTSPVVNITSLTVGLSHGDHGDNGDDNRNRTPGTNTIYSNVHFAGNTNVLVSSSVFLGLNTIVNAEHNKVTFFVGQQRTDGRHDNGENGHEGDYNDNDGNTYFTVIGGDTKVTANVYMPAGRLQVSGNDGDDDNWGWGDGDRKKNTIVPPAVTYMTGQFIANQVESDSRGVIWNGFDCTAPSLPGGTTSAQQYVQSTAKPAGVSELTVKAMPNPTTNFFMLSIESNDKVTPAAVRVVDASGRSLELFSKVVPGSTVTFGNAYAAGSYYAQVIQGGQHKVIKLIKQL